MKKPPPKKSSAAEEPEWDDVFIGSDGRTLFIGSDEVSYSPDSVALQPKNALKLLQWLEDHKAELEKLSQEEH